MSEAGKGVAAMVAACLIWGLIPIYYKALAHVDAVEILAHRTVWSFVIFAGVLALQGQLRALWTARGAVGRIALGAVLISLNWFLFILSVQWGRVVESALGYYIFPLVAVLIGRVVLGEVLSRAQWVAVALAGGAVLVLTFGLGIAPWIALILGGSFGLYGLVKKQLSVGPVVSVTGEVLVLTPLALVVLGGIHGQGGGVFGTGARDSLLLVFSGVTTALPLILFSYATRRVNLSTIGILQYINPTGQFLCAVILFAEPFTGWHMVAFAMIWTGLAIYSVAAVTGERAARRVESVASGSAATDTRSRSEASAKP